MKNIVKKPRKVVGGLLFICSFACIFMQCEKESSNPKYVPPTQAHSITHPNDIYLYENNGKSMFEKYNIANKWRWNDNILEVGDRATPIKSDLVIPIAKVLEYMWIGAYESIGEKGKDFFKKMKVAELQYIGSYIYRRNSLLLGFAEAGASITLLNLNSYKLNSRRWLTNPSGGILSTIHHEFAHTVHQKNNLPVGFNKISDSYLGNGWTNERDLNKIIKLGMVRNYGAKDEYEDFCEIISHFLTMKKDDFESKFITQKKCEGKGEKDCIELNEGKQKIKRKLDMILEFYKNKFDVDLVQVRDSLQVRIDYVLKHNKIPE